MNLSDNPGLTLVRAARAVAVFQGNLVGARAFAIEHWGPRNAVADWLERQLTDTDAIAPGSDALVNLGSPIVQLIGRRSIIGRIDAVQPFARVPPGAALLAITQAATASWTAEGALIANSSQAFEIQRFLPSKVTALVPYSAEFLRLIHAAVDIAVRRDIVNALADAEDESFCSPENTGTPGIEPASIFADRVQHGTGNPPLDVADLLSSLGPAQVAAAVLLVNPLTCPPALRRGSPITAR
ncbi:HK97 family phage major capsid protein [Paraburkholderia atlantica]|uniref:phage major capsid protein n=1 Tax=Paraburkholderia atlantica TaxID=2654982 RepID=UPI003D23AAA4